MMGTVLKAAKRLWRICTLRKGVYAKIGKGNKFGGNVFIHEMSQIGSYNYIGRGTMMTNAQVGSYCSIAPGVKIGQAEHSAKYITTYNRISEANIGFDMFKKKSIIGNDVWIGANAIVMQGVKIGTGAIIGGGAVVVRDVPDYAVAVGVPAKVIKYRFNDEQIKKLLDSRWWENDFSAAKETVKNLERDILNEGTAH